MEVIQKFGLKKLQLVKVKTQIWSNEQKIRAMISGTGFAGQGHADAFRAYGVEVVGIVGRTPNVVSKKEKTTLSFITAIAPFQKFDDRIDEDKSNQILKGWRLNSSKWNAKGTGVTSLTSEDQSLFFSVKTLELKNIQFVFSDEVDVFIKQDQHSITLRSLNNVNLAGTFSKRKSKETFMLHPGESVTYEMP